MFKAALALASASLLSSQHHYGQTRRPKAYRRSGRGAHPLFNLRTRTLHTHAGEITRRNNQAERVLANQIARAAAAGLPAGSRLSRRGQVISA